MRLPFSLRIVRGHSMQPRIRDGGRVLVFQWAYLMHGPRKGDVITFQYHGTPYVKRVIAVQKSKVVVAGDNAADSKKLPAIPQGIIDGKVLFSY